MSVQRGGAGLGLGRAAVACAHGATKHGRESVPAESGGLVGGGAHQGGGDWR